jgi:hypothetical protein
MIVCCAALFELRFGYGLGVSRDLCHAAGGRHATVTGRCVYRTCYWFGNCGTWANPGLFRDRLSRGDHISHVVFWLGEPDQVAGDRYLWSLGKGEISDFSVTIRNARLVSIEP